ncbi:hypothetical protein [Ralstonia chuxiongensis]|uniref:hypothetical protein n=1 Tax=Ralstonia chuxiongensis TaxID=2957504 RepID=UPI0028F6A40D|nr:hypothetical protein [Ralstonia chuxiongensis]CAJ0783309.1 hypothetical protein R8510_05116 [Ralstonia chuxiongensis]
MPYPLRIEYPALTNAQLALIGDRYGHDPVVRRLLMEVHALRNLVWRAHQVAEAAGPGGRTDAFSIAVEALHSELAVETWFHEGKAAQEAYRASLTDEPTPHERRTMRVARKW